MEKVDKMIKYCKRESAVCPCKDRSSFSLCSRFILTYNTPNSWDEERIDKIKRILALEKFGLRRK